MGALEQFEPARLATLKARAARASITVHEFRDAQGRVEFVATRWAYSLGFQTLDQLQAWLDQIGAPAA